MTRTEKKRILHKYNTLDNLIQIAIDNYNVVLSKATKITPSYSDGGGHSNGNTSKVEKYADILVQKAEKVERLKGYKSQIERELVKLRPHQRVMIKAVYIDGIPVERYAKMCKKPPDTIRHAINRAIDTMFE